MLDAGERDHAAAVTKRPRLSTALMCIAIFVLTVGVRYIHWRDNHVQITRSTTSLMGVFNRYRKEADRILADGSILFPRELPAPGDARMLAHPPGYSIILAGIKWASSRVYEALWLVQIAADGLTAVLILLIASRLFGRPTGLIAGTLVALSPQLAYYCLLLTPDSLTVLPLAAAVYALVIAMKRPRLPYFLCSGALVGLACWLGASAIGLALFLALLIPLLLPAGKRILYSVALVGAALVVIAPITIRNLIAYHRVIPISIQAGLSLAEGIGDFDRDGRLGMPRSDQEARIKDVEWSGHPEYGSSLWFPDGIERDRLRLSKGLEVVRSKPGWFLGVMLRRAAFMMRYNDPSSYGWPQDSSVVPFVQSQPPFSHELLYQPRQSSDRQGRTVLVYDGQVLDEAAAIPPGSTAIWSASASDLIASGRKLSSAAQIAPENGQALTIAGDNSTYDNQFALAPIKVDRYTDYFLVVKVSESHGPMALKILSPDMKRIVSTFSISEAVKAAGITKIGAQPLPGEDDSETMSVDLGDVEVQNPFASGPYAELKIAISNNGPGLAPPSVSLRSANLIAIGPTTGQITHVPRLVFRGLQRALFTTSPMRLLILVGVGLCAFARQFRSLLVLAAVPIYYLGAESLLHTEYRYILGIHYFAFIAAAVALNCGWSLLAQFLTPIAPTVLPGAARKHPSARPNGTEPAAEPLLYDQTVVPRHHYRRDHTEN